MSVVILRPYGEGDRELTLALESDPVVKRDLGGPIGEAEAERIHEDRLDRMRGGELFYTIGVAQEQEKVGIAAVFRTPWAGDVIHEAGVMLLPGRAGQGVGREALRLLGERAHDELGLAELHGFTAVTNVGGNAICRRLGWSVREEIDLDYEGRPLRCNHWVLDLRA
jgi:RimJ/RimL family protein N-acetyltransferase